MFTLLIILFSNFIINTNGVNPYQELERLLQDIPENIPEKIGTQKLLSYPPQNQHQSKDDHPINIETLNLFGKPHKRQGGGAELDKFLRTETNRICKETGRCGCSGPRCGHRPEDEAANEVDELVNEINKQLSTDDRNRDKDVVNGVKENNIFSNNKNYENVLEGKKIKLNDDVDIVVLKPEEIDDLLRKQNFIDLTKNSIILDTDTGKVESGLKNPDYLRELIAEIMKIAKSSNVKSGSNKNLNKVSPDDFFKYYKTLKNQITNLFAFYIKNNQNEIPIEEHLTDNQLQLLEELKQNYQSGDLRENKIKSEIIKVIFGKDGETQILPHYKDNQNIYIPKRFYDDVLKYKNELRSVTKRILPLTVQQKARLVTKNKARIIPKLIWRRSQGHDQNLGVPFNLEVRGLGQINPN